MRKFNFGFKKFSIFLCFVILISLFGFISKNDMPISKSVDFSKNGIVSDFVFNIEKHWVYQFSIAFGYPENDADEKSRVRNILGGNELNKYGFPMHPGIPVSLNLKIFKKIEDDYKIIYQKDIDPILTSWGGGKMAKNFSSRTLDTVILIKEFIVLF